MLFRSDIAQIPCVDGSRPLPPPVPSKSWVVVGPNAPGIVAASQASQTKGNLPEWVLDHIDAGQIELAPPFNIERIAVASSLALALTLARFASLGHLTTSMAGWGSAAGIVVAAVAIVVRYRGRVEFMRKTSLLVQMGGAKREIRRIEGTIRQLERERDRLLQREDRSIGNLNARISDLSSEEREELAAVDAWLARFQGGIAQKREELNKAEAAELAKVANSTPILFLGKRAQSIMKYYRNKRDPLQIGRAHV